MAQIALSYSAAQVDAAIAKINSLVSVIEGNIVQLYNGSTAIYPLTKAEAVFFDGDTSKTLDEQFSQLEQEVKKVNSQTNNSFYLEEKLDNYQAFEIPFNLKKGFYIYNKGVTLIVAKNRSLEERQDIPQGLFLLNSDKEYIQTSADSEGGNVNFEVLGYLDYSKWLIHSNFIPTKFTSEETYASYSSYYLKGSILLKGSTFINYGSALIIAENNNLDGRIDVGSGQIVILDSDKKHVRLGSSGGQVDFEVFYAPKKSIFSQHLNPSIFDSTLSNSEKIVDAKTIGDNFKDFQGNLNNSFYLENVTSYQTFKIPFVLKKGTYIKNTGVNLIVAKDSSLEGRQTIVHNTIILLDIDMNHIQTADQEGMVQFETLNYLGYSDWKEENKKISKRYFFENFDSYSTLNLYTFLPKGTSVINHGVPLIMAENNNLDGRIDVGRDKSVLLERDMFHFRNGPTYGNVDFEVFYAPEKSIFGNQIVDESIPKGKLDFIQPINLLLKGGELHIGQYYNASWWNTNPSYDSTSRIPIVEGQTYCFNTQTRFVHMCDESGNAIRVLENNPPYVTAESGEKYIVVTFYATTDKLYQIEEGTFPTPYIDPNKEYIKRELIPPVEELNLDSVITSFKKWNVSGLIKGGEQLNTPNINITKGITFTALVKGNIESITLGVGLNGYYGKNITLTPTEVIVRGGQSNNISNTYQHNLNITDFAYIQISKEYNTEAKLKISNDKGEIYQNTITWTTNIGLPFIMNSSSDTDNQIDVSFNVMPRDITKNIWMFGDSYFGMYDSSRWPYYILNWGYDQFLLDAKGGEAASESLEDFKSLLNLGARPKFVVWCLGMNGGSDGSTSPNATWLSKTQSMISLCLQYNIIPILATIPSVPNQIHILMNKWIKESGYRYIDFASAVENESDYYWKGWGTPNALLSSDEVHPSEKGALVLASQVMIDFPEITIL